MSSLQEQANYATKEGFFHKLRQGIITVAIAISAEDSSGDDALDASRLSFATTVLRDPDKWTRIMIYGFVTDSRVNASMSDQVIMNVINTIWNSYAGVNPNL